MTDITNIEIIMVGACAVSTALALLVEHYMLLYLLPKNIHRIAAYILGVLAIIGPVSMVLWITGQVLALALIWCSTVVGGLTVMGAYGIDWLVKRQRDRVDEIEQRAYERGKNDEQAGR